jgi:hypothetical protein
VLSFEFDQEVWHNFSNTRSWFCFSFFFLVVNLIYSDCTSWPHKCCWLDCHNLLYQPVLSGCLVHCKWDRVACGSYILIQILMLKVLLLVRRLNANACKLKTVLEFARWCSCSHAIYDDARWCWRGGVVFGIRFRVQIFSSISILMCQKRHRACLLTTTFNVAHVSLIVTSRDALL